MAGETRPVFHPKGRQFEPGIYLKHRELFKSDVYSWFPEIHRERKIKDNNTKKEEKENKSRRNRKRKKSKCSSAVIAPTYHPKWCIALKPSSSITEERRLNMAISNNVKSLVRERREETFFSPLLPGSENIIRLNRISRRSAAWLIDNEAPTCLWRVKYIWQ